MDIEEIKKAVELIDSVQTGLQMIVNYDKAHDFAFLKVHTDALRTAEKMLHKELQNEVNERINSKMNENDNQ